MLTDKTDLTTNLLTSERGPNQETPPLSCYNEDWETLPKYLQKKQLQQQIQQTKENDPASSIYLGSIATVFFIGLLLPSLQGDVSGSLLTTAQIASGGAATYYYLKAIYQYCQNEAGPSATEEKKSDVENQDNYIIYEGKSDNNDEAHHYSSHQESISSDDEGYRSCFGFSN